MLSGTDYHYESDLALFTFEPGKECVFRLYNAADFSKAKEIKTWDWLAWPGDYTSIRWRKDEPRLLHNFSFVFDAQTNFMCVSGEIQEWDGLAENERIYQTCTGETNYTISHLLEKARERLFIPMEMAEPWKKSRLSRFFNWDKWACNYQDITAHGRVYPLKNRKKFYREFIMQDTIRIVDLRTEKSK